ncbi:MAG: hypothetical protein LBL84_01735 [Candidatus Nomurabacteria bacterium]|jgi:hypothetical protein|nr:hypothetical protein [Candidatus Nomurabacteria bacterium]
MTKPGRFILNTDYASLANDAATMLSITIPTGVSIPYDQIVELASQTVQLGSTNAPIRVALSSSSNTGVITPCRSITVFVTTNLSSFDPVGVVVQRIGGNQVRLVAVSSMGPARTITGGSQTITARISTFLSPFVG